MGFTFYIDEVRVFFPYEKVYPEQHEYMRSLKQTLDAPGHCLLEMPTGTGKTVALFSLITSYQLHHPHIGKLVFCTRTIPEMNKALEELRNIVNIFHTKGKLPRKDFARGKQTVCTDSGYRFVCAAKYVCARGNFQGCGSGQG